MAENPQEEFNEELQETLTYQEQINEVLNSRRGIEVTILEDIRTGANILNDQLKGVRLETEQKALLTRVNKGLVNIAQQNYSITKDELGLAKQIEKTKKDQKLITQNILDLDSLKNSFKGENKELNFNIEKSMEHQVKLSMALNNNIKQIAAGSSTIKSNGGVKFFQGVENIFTAIPFLKQYSGATQIASEAARKQALYNKETFGSVKGISQQQKEDYTKSNDDLKKKQDDYKKIKELQPDLADEDIVHSVGALDQAGITSEELKMAPKPTVGIDPAEIKENETFNKLLEKRKEHYKSLRGKGIASKSKVTEGALSKAKIAASEVKMPPLPVKSISAMSAGFKSLGPVIMKALGPVALIAMAAKAIKAIFDQMMKASQEVAELSRNMLITRDAAASLRQETFQIARSYSQIASAQGEVTIGQEEYMKALQGVNSVLGFQLNLAEEFGEEIANSVGTVAVLSKQMGLSSHASADLFLGAAKSHKDLKDYTQELMGTVALESARVGLNVNMKETIEAATKVSGVLKANFKGSYTEIAKAVFQAKVLGLTLEQIHGTTSSLLNFESSIADEIEAEMLTGKQLNLEKARYYALTRDTKGLMKEITKELGTQAEWQSYNVLEQESLAKLFNKSADEVSDMFQEQQYNQTLQKNHQEWMLEQKAKGEIFDLRGKRITDLSVEGLAKAAREGKLNAEDSIKLLGKEEWSKLQSQSAQEKFNDALTSAKDIFAEFVSSGALDTFATFLKDVTDSWLFSGTKDKNTHKNRAEDLESRRDNGDKTITQEQIDTEKDLAKDKNFFATWAPKLSIHGWAINKLTETISGDKKRSEELHNTLMAQDKNDKLSEKEKEKNLNNQKTQGGIFQKVEGIPQMGETQTPEKHEDFIMRPGQKPISYRKDDIIIGGTNLLGEKNQSKPIEKVKDIKPNIVNNNNQSTTINNQLKEVIQPENVTIKQVPINKQVLKDVKSKDIINQQTQDKTKPENITDKPEPKDITPKLIDSNPPLKDINPKIITNNKTVTINNENSKVTNSPQKSNNEQTNRLLERIANTLEKGGDIHLDGAKVGKALVTSVSSLG